MLESLELFSSWYWPDRSEVQIKAFGPSSFFEMCPKYPPSEIAGLMKPAYENPLVTLNEAGD